MMAGNDDLAALREQTALASAAAASVSDLDFAYQLQLAEAIQASLLLDAGSSNPSSSKGKAPMASSSAASSSSQPAPAPAPPQPSDASIALAVHAADLARAEEDHRLASACRVYHARAAASACVAAHDAAFARELARVPEDRWAHDGDNIERPLDLDAAKPLFRVLFKGMTSKEVVKPRDRDPGLAVLAVALCDSRGEVVLRIQKPVEGFAGGGRMMLELMALTEGLQAAVGLGIQSLTIVTDYRALHNHMLGIWRPQQKKLVDMIDQVESVQKKFKQCEISLVERGTIDYVMKLARDSLISQIAKAVAVTASKEKRETCAICLEDTDVSKIHAVEGCAHRFCFCCMKEHVKVKLLDGILPACPQEGCTTKLTLEGSKIFLSPRLLDIMVQHIREGQIHPTQKIYCPYPKCSFLMSLSEMKQPMQESSSRHTVADAATLRKCGKCYRSFCINCKVPWHDRMTCYDYKIRYPQARPEDAKLQNLARQQLWRQCVKCKHMIELAEGCYHMTCVCGYEFCYTCGKEWKGKKATCTCPLWDEHNIIRDDMDEEEDDAKLDLEQNCGRELEEAAAMAEDPSWNADKILDVYIHDYLVKRNLQKTAKAFQAEGNLSPDPVAIDAPGGFLFEWWSVFWDIFISRTNDKHSDVANSYIETQSIKSREQQSSLEQQQQHVHAQQSPQQIHMHQLLLQRQQQEQQQQQHQQQHPQQQRRHQKQQQRNDSNYLPASPQNGSVSADPPPQLNTVATNSSSPKIYEERMKIPVQSDTLDEASIKQRFNENIGQLLESNPASLLKSSALSAHASGQIFQGSAGGVPGTLQQAQARSLQLQGSTQEIKADTNATLNLRAAGADGSLLGIPGTNQAGHNLTLKGWPLTGLDQLRSGYLQQKSFVQTPQALHHLQFLTPQQQQLLLQAQQNITSSSTEMDGRRLRMLLSSRNMVPGRDGPSNAFPEIIPSVGPSLQNMYSHGQRIETDMLMKKIAAMQQQQQCSSQQQQSSSQQQLLQQSLLSQQPQSSNHYLDFRGHHEKMVAGSGVIMDGLSCNSFRGNEQVSKNQNGRKRKQPASSSGPANSSGTMNTAGPCPSSAPSTPSTDTPGDTISMPSMHHNASISKSMVAFGADAPGTGESPTDQIVGMDRLGEDDCLGDNVDSFLSHDDAAGPSDARSRCMASAKGLTFREISSARASTNKVVCCHFSSDGKLLATGGHDKKVVLWHAETLKQKATLEDHSLLITDVRFSPSGPLLATSSFDKTVRVWDLDNQDVAACMFTGHSASVMSLDFHPNKDDLMCSCDGNSEIRFWSINNGRAVRIFKGGSSQLRFQPRHGAYLAVASENVVSILDVETQACVRRFEGHTAHVDSVCWSPSGEYLASTSEDTVKVWSLNSASENSVQELNSNGNKFHACTFHPSYPSLLIVGGYQSLELWDLLENRSMTVAAHDGLVSALASSSSGLVASVSHDKHVKLWK